MSLLHTTGSAGNAAIYRPADANGPSVDGISDRGEVWLLQNIRVTKN